MERSSDSQNKKKIVHQILGYISFYFEIAEHLVICINPKIIKFDR